MRKTILSNACNWLISQHWLDYNPFSGLPRHRFKKSIKHHVASKSLTQDEWKSLIHFCKNSYASCHPVDRKRMLFILEFAYYTGARLSEIAKARTSDIYRKNNHQDSQYWIKIIGKGQKERHVPFIPPLLKSFNRYWGVYHPESFWHLVDEPLIGSLRKQRQLSNGTWHWHTPSLTSNGLHQIIKRFISTAKLIFPEPERIEKITMHWLRHTHGSHAMSNNVPLVIIRDNLGHQNLATTSIYSHEDENKRWEAIKEGFEN